MRTRLESPRVCYATPGLPIGTTRVSRRRQLPTNQCHAALPSRVIRAFSLIRRRSRPIVTPAPTPSGSRPHHRENFTDVNVDREIDDAQTNRLTAGPSISAEDGGSQERAALVNHRPRP